MCVVDSNILINLLGGNKNAERWLQERKKESDYLIISIVTKIEVLSFSELQESAINKALELLGTFNTVVLGEEIADLAASLRRQVKLSLADAVVLATTLRFKATLVTNDKVLIRKSRQFVPVLSV